MGERWTQATEGCSYHYRSSYGDGSPGPSGHWPFGTLDAALLRLAALAAEDPGIARVEVERSVRIPTRAELDARLGVRGEPFPGTTC